MTSAGAQLILSRSRPCWIFIELPVLERALEEVFGRDATHAQLRDASAFNDTTLNSLLGLLLEELMRQQASPTVVHSLAEVIASGRIRMSGPGKQMSASDVFVAA